MIGIRPVPAYFHTRIHLNWSDRLRVLWHGRIDYRGEVFPDPGDFEIEAVVNIPRILPQKLQGYEEVKN